MDFRNPPYRRPGPNDGISEVLQRYLPFFPWAVGLLLLVWLLSDITFTVQPYEQAAILRFGRSYTTAQPGLHFKLPLVDQVLKISVEEHGLRLPLGTPSHTEEELRGSISSRNGQQDDETLMLTGDLNTASVEWTVQWKVTDPAEFLFRFPLERNENFADELITTVSRTVMNRLVGDYSFDEVIGAKRSDIAFEARRDTQRILETYACGITVTALQMQRVIPPDRVKPAFDRVNASIQEKQKLENEAEAARNKLIPEARANKDKLIREAEGYSGRKKAESSGEIDALLAKYHAFQRSPEITRQRLYLEAMQEVLQGVKNKLIIDSDLKQTLPFLNLDPKGEAR